MEEFKEEREAHKNSREIIEHCEAQYVEDRNKILFLSGFMDPILAISDRVNKFYDTKMNEFNRLPMQDSASMFVSRAPSSSPQQERLLAWINDVSSDRNVNRRHPGVSDFLPFHFEAAAADELMSGVHFCRVVAALIANSDVFAYEEPSLPDLEEFYSSEELNLGAESKDDKEPSSAELLDKDEAGTAPVGDSINAAESDLSRGIDLDPIAAIPPEPNNAKILDPSNGNAVRELNKSQSKEISTGDTTLEDSATKGQGKAAAFTQYLKDINNHRASPADLISLSMKAAGEFLNCNFEDFHESLQDGSVTTLLYRFSHLKMFSENINGIRTTVSIDDIKALRVAQRDVNLHKDDFSEKLKSIRRISLYHSWCTYGVPQNVSAVSNVETNDIDTSEATQDESAVNIAESGETPAATVVSEVKLEDPIQIDSSEVAQPPEGLDISVPDIDPRALLDAEIERILRIEDHTQTPQALMHVDRMLRGIEDFMCRLNEIRQRSDDLYFDDAFEKARFHSIITEKAVNFLKF